MKRLAVFFAMLLVACVAGGAGGQIPTTMKFTDVKEIAPGVFFRYSAISATDLKVVFGGCNNIWVVMDEYVVAFDANFPQGAGEVIAEIKKTTKKPIRYVIDSHHHGDHAYGNAVFAKEGATILAQALCAKWLREKGDKEFADAGKGPTGRKDVREGTLKQPTMTFDDKHVLDDGKMRCEILFFGHGHTPGDAFLYLPKQKILCTGDACVNGAFNYMGHADTASWIKVLEKAGQLDVEIVLPGHGLPAKKDLLVRQGKYFAELRQAVNKGINAGKNADELKKSIDMPWYKDWTGTTPAMENIKHVYDEMLGKTPMSLLDELAAREGTTPTKGSVGWMQPRRIVVPNLMPARLAELKALVPEVEFVAVRDAGEAAKSSEEADAVLGFCTPEILRAGKKLRWIQASAQDAGSVQQLGQRGIVLTDTSIGGERSEAQDRTWRLFRENVRRFAAGERLLCVVDVSSGF
jgi:cyclase